MSLEHQLLNESEDRGGEGGVRGEDEGDAEIEAEEEVVVVMKIMTEKQEIVAEIVEEADQDEEVKEAEILREKTAEEIVMETVA